MAYDYSKLLGKIKEKYGTQASFAEAIGISGHSLSTKLNNKKAFRQSEISKAIALLDIDAQDLHAYFFTLKVQ